MYLWQIAEGRVASDKFEWGGVQYCLFKDVKQTRKMTVVTWDPKDGNILFIGDTLGDIKMWVHTNMLTHAHMWNISFFFFLLHCSFLSRT